MEAYYIFIVAILIVLAVSDLIVGVSNDAVNFLNSSIGSKVAPFKVIMVIASLGILIGTTFSSGMMEVARKGIFHPDQFYFDEIMIIFLAVMLTDILLLDLFNTFALPTSTTVSIVFELLGASVAVSIIKISALGDSIGTLGNYINSSSALVIIAGILLSVVIAFSVGLAVQWIVRIIFSFDYEKTFKYFGAIWGGIAISVITYFILIKGAKGSSLLSSDLSSWISSNTALLLLGSFVGWTILLQLIYVITKFNILKLIVLVGTFGLALAFAGNDLVNFVGVPLAALESLKSFFASGISDPAAFGMSSLGEKIQTPTYILLLSGLVMVIALFKSKKARSVTATELNLSRQEEGYERFDSSILARNIVRGVINISNSISGATPPAVEKYLERRFDQKKFEQRAKKEGVSFDLIRASVNLVVASALIALGTSLKLPLSTTYVTFMVAMGSSLADRAWGRDSAVYRVSGVITVIGGWFFTAFSAFTAAFVMAYLIHLGGLVTIIALIVLIVVLLFKSSAIHKKRETEKVLTEDKELVGVDVNGESILRACRENVISTISAVAQLYNKSISGLLNFKRKPLFNATTEVTDLKKDIRFLKDSLPKIITRLHEEEIESGHYYVQVIDYLKETANTIGHIVNLIFIYIDNNHKPLSPDQKSELSELKTGIDNFLNISLKVLEEDKFEELEKIEEFRRKLVESVTKINKKQLKRIKNKEVGTKNSTLYLNTLSETKNLLLFVLNLLKAQRDFLVHNNGKPNAVEEVEAPVKS